jgi:polysaccharide export outer membrane protein
MKTRTLLRLILGIIILTFCASLNTAYAQNFATFSNTDTVTDSATVDIDAIEQQAMEDGELSDEEIQNILQLHQAGSAANTQTAPSATTQPASSATPQSASSTLPVSNTLTTTMPELAPILEAGDESTYTLGPTDEIEITVGRHPEVTGRFSINSEGKIQYRFVGDVKVVGMTKSQVAEHITTVLSEYIISPEVTVIITGYNSKIVYVIGEVGHPGKIFMRGDTITVREALVQAGLPLLSANTPKSVVITPADSGKAEQKKTNVHKLLYEGDLRENVMMKPGDTLYIPPTFLAKAMRVIQPVSQPIGAAASTGRTVTTGF